MDANGRQEVGLFRYGVIRDAADPGLSKVERGRLVCAICEREHVGPDGRIVRIGRTTMDRWIRAYRQGGFAALVPQPRVVAPRAPAETLALAFELKRERPERTAAQVREIMLAAGGPTAPGLRTLQTHFARAGLNVRADGRSPGRVYGRFEASARNELWTGDGLHGPTLSGTAARRAVLLAFIDDHSRLLVGWRWGTGEDVFRLEAALRSGLMARGVPDAILVDRGSPFVSSQLLRACAVLGVKLIHASPRAATTKGKIERFFRTRRQCGQRSRWLKRGRTATTIASSSSRSTPSTTVFSNPSNRAHARIPTLVLRTPPTAPFQGFLTVRAGTVEAQRRAHSLQPPSGRPAPRPHSQTARTAAIVKQSEQPANNGNDARTSTATEALLDRRRPARATPRPRSPHPRKEQ